MFNLPLTELKKKIREQKNLSDDQINNMIADKMRQLSGLISEEGACHIIANELGVSLAPKTEDLKVKDLVAGLRDVKLNLRVIQVYELRTFQSRFDDSEGKVISFLAGDETANIRVTCWGEKAEEASKLKPGDIVQVTNAYVKENQGRLELHMNNNSGLLVNPQGVEVETPSNSYERKNINALSQGDVRVELLGTVVQIYDPRVFERDDSKGVVVNLLLDDGTGNIRCAFWGEQAANLLNVSLADLIENQSSFEDNKTDLLGNIILVGGRVKLNTIYNSLELNVDYVNLTPDPAKELKEETVVNESSENNNVLAQDDSGADKIVSDDDYDFSDLDDLDDLDDL